jgi:hypothetical protein
MIEPNRPSITMRIRPMILMVSLKRLFMMQWINDQTHNANAPKHSINMKMRPSIGRPLSEFASLMQAMHGTKTRHQTPQYR